MLVTGEPGSGEGNARPNAKPLGQFVSDFPISDAGKAQIVALYSGVSDPLTGKSQDDKRAILKRTSYRDYLTKICGCSEEVANCFQGRPLGFFGLGADAVPAADARDLGYPGFSGLKLTSDTSPAWQEPYIYHFPDGNASIARLLVRSLIPGAAPGKTMDDIVPAAFDYGALDRSDQPVRIRLDFNLCGGQPEWGQGACRLHSRRLASSCRCASCGARLLPHDDPAYRPGIAGAAARGACKERQDADLLHQRIGTELACVCKSQGQFDRGANGIHTSCRSIFRSASAAIATCATHPSQCCCISSTCPARRTRPLRARPVSYRAGQAIRDDIRGLRGTHSRRLGSHAPTGGFSMHAILQRSPSTAGRTATATWPIRSTIGTTTRARSSRSRGSHSGLWRSPTPTPVATPGCTTPSIRPTARSRNWWDSGP